MPSFQIEQNGISFSVNGSYLSLVRDTPESDNTDAMKDLETYSNEVLIALEHVTDILETYIEPDEEKNELATYLFGEGVERVTKMVNFSLKYSAVTLETTLGV